MGECTDVWQSRYQSESLNGFMHLPCSKSMICTAAAFATSASLNAASFANGNFGRQQSWKVDAAVYAQPLFAPGTSLALLQWSSTPGHAFNLRTPLGLFEACAVPAHPSLQGTC